MDQLGIRDKELRLTTDRRLHEVSGSYTYFADGDVLLAKITPCFENGKLGIARGLTNGVGYGSSEFIVFRPGPDLNPEYLFYFLSQDSFKDAGASVMSGAVGHKRVPKQFIENYLIPIPSLEEQKRIVAILDEAFAGIDRAIANTEKNLANASSLFDSYLDRRLFSVASGRPIQSLSSITRMIIDCEHKTAPTQDTGFPSIRTPNVGKGHLILDNVKCVSEETYKHWKRRAQPEAGDLILAREAPAGNVGVVPEGKRVCLGQRTVLIRPNHELVVSQYLTYLLLHSILQRRLLSHSTGATVEHVNMRDIRGLGVSGLPPKEEQLKTVELIDSVKKSVVEIVSLYEQKLAALSELKQSLLQKAFSGELTAPRAEKELADAVA